MNSIGVIKYFVFFENMPKSQNFIALDQSYSKTNFFRIFFNLKELKVPAASSSKIAL
jgi:hypothetical protein